LIAPEHLLVFSMNLENGYFKNLLPTLHGSSIPWATGSIVDIRKPSQNMTSQHNTSTRGPPTLRDE
jgi:hypothetical protein